MVLRDTYINSTLRGAILSLLIFTGACQQSPSNSSTSTSTAQPAAKESGAPNNPVSNNAQALRGETLKVLEDMNGVYRDAENLRLKGMQEKGGSNNGNVDAVYEKSAITLGAIFILQGSVNAVDQRFQEGVLDQKQAEDMLNKLRLDVKSYQSDIKSFREMLNEAAPAAAEKK